VTVNFLIFIIAEKVFFVKSAEALAFVQGMVDELSSGGRGGAVVTPYGSDNI
jgi:hypothetical protein